MKNPSKTLDDSQEIRREITKDDRAVYDVDSVLNSANARKHLDTLRRLVLEKKIPTPDEAS